MSKGKEMAALDFSKYQGKYVALINRRVVASGNNARIVWAKAKKLMPAATPTLVKVPRDETLVLRVCG
jgi:hypothetical protein